MAVAAKTNLKIGEVLLESGDITKQQLEQALELQKTSTKKKRLGEVLLEYKIVEEGKMLSALAKRLNLKYVTVNDQPIDLKAVGTVPRAVAHKYAILPIGLDGSVLRVLMNDPLDYYAIEDIKFLTGMQIEVAVCKKNEIIKAINESYSELETQKAAQGANETAANQGALSYIDISESVDDTPVVTLINSTLYKAHSAGASDIHIEPFDKCTKIRIRVDGQIVNYLTLSQSLHVPIAARIKILGGLDIAEKRQPQDGHFRAKLNDIEINVRVSTLPTVYGEKIVLRFMSQNSELDHSGTFGMERDDYEKMLRVLQVPHGLIYITGPTGSGKTTTLYMIMEMLAKRHVSIATIEDPVERNLEDINQTQINPLAGLTFESGLRSILRQDPDIVMIGETRDSETASISVRAALTGHMVLSTLHTNDSVSTIARLLDMGIEDYLLANSLIAVVAQRLVKRICPYCKEEYVPSEAEIEAVGGGVMTVARGKGCHNCNFTGYKGRVAVHEILTMDNTIRNMISRRANSDDIYTYVKESYKLKTLQTSLTRLVLEKKTTVEELVKLTYFVE